MLTMRLLEKVPDPLSALLLSIVVSLLLLLLNDWSIIEPLLSMCILRLLLLLWGRYVNLIVLTDTHEIERWLLPCFLYWLALCSEKIELLQA